MIPTLLWLIALIAWSLVGAMVAVTVNDQFPRGFDDTWVLVWTALAGLFWPIGIIVLFVYIRWFK